MLRQSAGNSIDYLVVGHLTQDINPSGSSLGGSAAYAALTAAAFGLRVGILTAFAEDLDIAALDGIEVVNIGAEQSTRFENSIVDGKRRQQIHSLASPLHYGHVPDEWRNPKIAHLAPVMGEISPRMAREFPDSTLGITPQGWLRKWESNGQVELSDWPEANFVLQQADAAVISIEDVDGKESLITGLAASAAILVVTEAEKGARIFHQGGIHTSEALPANEVDAIGAGDIFAAAFFIRSHFGDGLAEAGRVANGVASSSVERIGLASAPTGDEVLDLMPRAIFE